MAQILFASNNPTHWGTIAQEGNTDFDASRVPYSIRWSGGGIESPMFKQHAGNITWVRFYFHGSVSAAGSNEQAVFTVLDQDRRALIRGQTWNNSASGRWIWYNADGASTESGTIGAVNTPAWYDIKFEITPFAIIGTVYINNILAGTYTYNSNVAGVTGIGYVQFHQGTSSCSMSEFIVSDGDTRLARLNMVRPQGIGNYAQWLGDVATLADNNLNTGLTTVTPNHRSSVIMQPYTNNEIISNVVVASQHLRGQNSPSKIRHFLRASAIDYDDAAAFDVDFGATVTQSDYALNPATSLPWDLASLGTAEFGFKSEV